MSVREENGSLRGRVASGFAWAAGSIGILQLLGMIQTVVLARLLVPADFGTYGMVTLATGTLQVLTRLGVNEGVIQSRYDVRDTLDSAFVLNLARGALLFTLVLLLAPFIETFFATPGVALMLRVASVTVLLGAANNVGPILFAKDLDYRRAMLWGQIPPVTSILASLVFAWWIRSAWAFVFASVTTAAATLPLSYWVHPYRPRLRPRLEPSRHLFRYGTYVLGSQPFLYLSNRIDDVVVGRRFGSHDLGAYQLAYSTAALPATQISQVVMSVLFPVFARLQTDSRALAEAYLKTLRHVAALSFPMSAFLGLFAGEIVALLYGARWRAVAPLVVAFSLYGALRSVGGVVFEVFKATGNMRETLHLAILNLAGIAWVLAVASAYGPIWIALLISAISVPFLLYAFSRAGDILGLGIAPMVRACVAAAIATVAASAVALFAGALVGGLGTSAARLAAAAGLFGTVYPAVLALLDHRWLPEMLSLVHSLRADVVAS